MNRDAILRKVKACPRLAASSNPNEAAAALRQAQAMMRAHGISWAGHLAGKAAKLHRGVNGSGQRALGREPA